MRASLVHVLPLALLPAVAAGAADLELGLDAGLVYNSNLFSTESGEVSDYSGRVGPRLRAMDELGAFTWDVRYWPAYEKYLDIDDADGWDHDVSARASWGLSSRTRLSLDGRYLDTGNVNEVLLRADPGAPPIDVGVQFGRDRFKTSNAVLTLDHDFAPRHSTTLRLQRADSEFDRELGTSDSQMMAVSGSYLYMWDRRNRVGFLLSGTEQEVGLSGPASEPTRYYNASLQWARTFDPTLTLSASAGPTWVDQDRAEFPRTIRSPLYPVTQFRAPSGLVVNLPTRASSCPRNGRGELVFSMDACQSLGAEAIPVLLANPAAFDGLVDISRRGSDPTTGESLTYFANIDLTKKWRDVTLTLSYGRDASSTSELSGVVLDTLSAYVVWTPSPKWSVALQSSYQRREQPNSSVEAERLVEPVTVGGVSDVAAASGFRLATRERTLEIDDYYAGLFVNYSLTRSTRLYLQLSYQYEDIRNELDRLLFEESNWDRYYVAIGVTYTLPRFHLPF